MTTAHAGQYGPDTITDVAGRPLRERDVGVTLAGTSTAATLYVDRDRSATTETCRTDQAGNLRFWTEPGRYDVHVDGRTIAGVMVHLDPADAQSGEVEAEAVHVPAGTSPEFESLADPPLAANVGAWLGAIAAAIFQIFSAFGPIVEGLQSGLTGVHDGLTAETAAREAADAALQAILDALVLPVVPTRALVGVADGGDVPVPIDAVAVLITVTDSSTHLRWQNPGPGRYAAFQLLIVNGTGGSDPVSVNMGGDDDGQDVNHGGVHPVGASNNHTDFWTVLVTGTSGVPAVDLARTIADL